MNNDKFRHKILGILLIQRFKCIDGEVVDEEDNKLEPLGVSYEELSERCNLSINRVRMIMSQCLENTEVKYFQADFEGFYLTEKGVEAHTDKKYLRLTTNRRYELVKNWIQILVPVLALLCTLFTIISSNNRINQQQKEVDALKSELRELMEHSNK